MKIAAVVTCYNRKEKTLRFLRSIQQQTYQSLDVILVDASSIDGTAEAVRRHFPKVKILQVDDQCYWAAATNHGVKAALDAGYDAILTINDDCTIVPNYVERLAEIAQRNDVKILASRIDYLGHPGLIWALGTQVSWGIRILQLAWHDVQETDLPAAIRTAEVIDVEAAAGDGVLIHRSVFEQIGLYAEKLLPHYHADSELILRARKAGIRACVTPQVVVYDDSPSPETQRHNAQQAFARPWLPEFIYTFFHQRSSWFLPTRVYLTWQYCPLPWKIATLLQVTIVAMLGWLAKRQLKLLTMTLISLKSNSNKVVAKLLGLV
ncbi:MAG: hypothetical protein B0A82_23990 [Alkalinema sp. CACIAM 70d]|nr:MAG: hypothetical protein B0A82_23990 [Alkalinema sp. CACIAM 70d]